MENYRVVLLAKQRELTEAYATVEGGEPGGAGSTTAPRTTSTTR